MTALIGVLGALGGTVLGAFITQLLQRRTVAAARLHESRISGYSEFASALTEYRTALMDRWFAGRTDNGERADAAPDRAVNQNVYQARTAASAAYFQIALLAGNPEIVAAADRARTLMSAINDAEGKDQFAQAIANTDEALLRFITAARGDVTPGAGAVVVSDRVNS